MSQDMIQRYPKNFDELKKKFKEREEEQLKKALERHDAKTTEELLKIGKKALQTRSDRQAADYKPLKDRTVIREPQSEEVKSQMQRIDDEIKAISKEILSKFSPSTTKKVILDHGEDQKPETEAGR